MVSQGGSRVPVSLPLGHPGSPAPCMWADCVLWAEQSRCQAAAPFPNPFLFIRAWVSPLSFPPLQEDRDSGSHHLLPPAPCLRGYHDAQLELRQLWDELFQPEHKHSSEAMPWPVGTSAGPGGGSSSKRTLMQKPPSPVAAFSPSC